MTRTQPAQTMRIGELAARTGVSVHVLRVWERRYGLLTPTRSPGGYRLYGPQDEWRVRMAARLREEGHSAAQAAAAALQASRELPGTAGGTEGVAAMTPGPQGVGQLRERLIQAVAEFDGTAAQAILDVALEHLGVEATITDLLMPILRETGERWAAGEFTIAQEHYASNLVRARLSSLSLSWDAGTGPLAVLACPSGERHDLGLLSFGVVLGRTGWRVRYLGADTPMATLGTAVMSLAPDVVVLASVREHRLLDAAREIEQLPADVRHALAATDLVVAGAGATPDAAERLGATLLEEDPVGSVRQLAERRRAAGAAG